jgi:hypothetical protein
MTTYTSSLCHEPGCLKATHLFLYMLEVRPDGYTLTETEGEMYFCNARCLCIWAVQLATRPNLANSRKLPSVQLTQPTGEQRTFADVGELAKWSVANALDDGKQIV